MAFNKILFLVVFALFAVALAEEEAVRDKRTIGGIYGGYGDYGLGYGLGYGRSYGLGYVGHGYPGYGYYGHGYSGLGYGSYPGYGYSGYHHYIH